MIMPKFCVKWSDYGNKWPSDFSCKGASSMIILALFKDNVILFGVKGNIGDFYL